MGIAKKHYTQEFLDDQDLLQRHRAGDPAAFGELFAKHRRFAYSRAWKYVATSDQADDLVVEAFTQILETIRRGKGPTISMSHYLISTIRSIARDEEREEKAEVALDPEDLARLYEGEHFAISGYSAEWLSEAFNSLSARSQQVLWYRAVENIPSREIAELLGVSSATATRAYQSAAAELREQFVVRSVAASPNRACREYAPMLQEVARRKGRSRGVALSPGLREHLETCNRCVLVESRLRGSDRVLLSIVFLAGLGTLAAESLRSTPASATAASLFASVGAPLKAAMVVVPLVAAVVLGGVMWSPPLSDGMQVQLGESIGAVSTLLRVGSCELQRQAVDVRTEVWSLSEDSASCNVKIEVVKAAESGANNQDPVRTTVLDTTRSPRARALEVVRPGTYSVTLSDDTSAKKTAVNVRSAR
ncbi:sigma-70 family RNA polymerase sigma factor [Leucobacter viscericola]|uniref:Sigma-70 family RNA polymerase sigma factor n=1 Tax=Leucobacter viscericola TaxID=2714935 RepID=A0A6G7XFZ3_9MICO|nr:sigma-70 family RNA polymerase sigma factor [Leucobacter viscericola]QIK63291.1 sigma-70 family RNA polymerase sigma factor [Leucobacter viscericola]